MMTTFHRMCGVLAMSLLVALTACDSAVIPASTPNLIVPLDAFMTAHFCADIAVTQGDTTATKTTCGRDPQPTVVTFPCAAPATVAITLTPTSPDALAHTIPNACPAGAPCILSAACQPDSDTNLAYSVTIMRNTEQGFLDLVIGLTNSEASSSALDDVIDFCVGIAVRRDDETLWSVPSICYSKFGHSDVITFVGPCDASGSGQNTVDVTLLSALDTYGALVNGVALPCGDGTRCTLTVPCTQNADTRVNVMP
jgi:hypothetical protein